MAWRGKAQHGSTWTCRETVRHRPGAVGLGGAWQGQARQGKARQSKVKEHKELT